MTVIYISHRLAEVEHCADRVVVLRDGARASASSPRGEIRHETMIRLMVGRDLKSLYIRRRGAPGRPVCEVAGLRTTAHPDQARRPRRCCAGEILGMAGLVGAGRTELALRIFGIDRIAGGAIRLDGEPVRDRARRATPSIAASILVPEDRKRSGLVLEHVGPRQHLAAEPAGLRLRAC